jgi:hypothetical protein
MADKEVAPAPNFDAVKQDYVHKYKSLAAYVPELIAIQGGLRQALQIVPGGGPDSDKNIEELSAYCAKAGLQRIEYASEAGPRILVSREKTAVPEFSDGFGRLFGYPECCIRHIAGLDRTFDLTDTLRDFWKSREQPFELNVLLRTSPFHLIQHLPCAPDCPATLDAARKLLAEIDRVDPALGGHIRAFNRLPALYTDVCGVGILFHGRFDGASIRYRRHFDELGTTTFGGHFRYSGPEDIAVLVRLRSALSRGDELALEADRATISLEGKPVESVERPPRLTWKLLDFR